MAFTPKFKLKLGLIMKGGSSLAIYMNGVAQELLALSMAALALRQADTEDAPAWVREQRSTPYYRLLEQAGVEFEIDVIAGTSAGGLNGLILAKALASGADDLRQLTQLWKETAQIYTLASYKGQPKSLLDGAPMEEKLFEVMQDLSSQGEHHPDRADAVKVLDLFVTATDVRGHRWVRRDRFNQQIEGKAHKYLFHLKKRAAVDGRGYDRNDFVARGPGQDQEKIDKLLMKIGRATSAFPGVFPPIEISRADGVGTGVNVLGDVEAGYQSIWFSDGGILVNRPFDPVLETIFERSSDGPMRRAVVYVEPDPEVVRVEKQTEPTMLETALASVTLPMSQDILDSMNHLEREIEHRRQVRGMIESLEPRATADAFSDTPELGAYYDARLARLREVLRGALEQALEGQGVTKDALLAGAVQAVIGAIGALREDHPDHQGHAAFLAQYDTQYHARRLHYVLTRLHDQLSPGSVGSAAAADAIKGLLGQLWGALEDWNNAAWMLGQAGRLDETSAGRWPEQAAALNGALRSLAAAVKVQQRSAAAVGEAASLPVAAVVAAIKGFVEHVEQAAKAAEQAAWEKAAAGGRLALNVDALKAVSDGFAALDVVLMPVQAALGGGLDTPNLYQFSPGEAQGWVRKRANEKLTGDALGHFAAFLDEKWRSNDIMWGRLDAAELLTQMIVKETTGVDAKGRIPEAELPGYAQATLRDRRWLILSDFPELIDLPALQKKVGAETPPPPTPAMPWLPRMMLRIAAPQAAAALMAEGRRDFTAGQVPPEVLRDYLEKEYNVGKEGLDSLPPRRVAGEILLLLYNAATALQQQAPTAVQGFLQKMLLVVLRPLYWVARLVLLPRTGVLGLAQNNLAGLMTLVGGVLLVLWATGVVTLNLAGKALMVALLLPAVVDALFRSTWSKVLLTGLAALVTGGLAVAPPGWLSWMPQWLADWLVKSVGGLWPIFAAVFVAFAAAFWADLSWRRRMRAQVKVARSEKGTAAGGR